ncbi:MAG: diguanylate cyclase, partial [Gammaproteobacteria bacterium]|nr:diguanylate cyclase [Gammaproteobacteria bacterium]
LREITRMFSEMIRSRDTFARLGGDEFGLLLEHCGPGVAEQIASSLHAILVQRPLRWRDDSFSLTVSIGGVLIRS